jgi:hypothetical protein
LKKLFIDAKPGVMQDLETVHRLEGISGVSRLARKWKNSQPQGYLFWLSILKNENDNQGIVKVSKEGLKALMEGKARERVAEFLIDAATNLIDSQHLLLGKRERFFSQISDQNLLDLVNEAIRQNVRGKELDRVIRFFKTRKSMDDEKKYYNEKYKRFSAFRREVKAVVLGSELLRNSGFFP